MYQYNDYGEPISRFHNIKGKPIEKTPFSHPYSYEQYEIYKSNDWSETDSGAYSDRMMQWDLDKFTRCAKKAFGINCGQYFNDKKPEDVETFLSLYFETKLKLTGIEQACNMWTGYPYWIFYYKEEK